MGDKGMETVYGEGKRYFVLGWWEQPRKNKNLLYQYDKPNEPRERTPFICPLLVLTIHLSFNSQQGPPLSGLSNLTYHSLCVGVAEVGGVGRSVVNHRLVYGVGRLVGEYTGGEAGHHLDKVLLNGQQGVGQETGGHHLDKILLNGQQGVGQKTGGHHLDRVLLTGNKESERGPVDSGHHLDRVLLTDKKESEKGPVDTTCMDRVLLTGNKESERGPVDSGHHLDRVLLTGNKESERGPVDSGHHLDRVLEIHVCVSKDGS
jgi:hypothetical protein